MSRRCGIDQRAFARLENSHNKIPTLDTLGRHAAAVGAK
jgi:hypothetical protein